MKHTKKTGLGVKLKNKISQTIHILFLNESPEAYWETVPKLWGCRLEDPRAQLVVGG